MALSRSAMLMISAGALATASVAAIGYRVWRDFYAPAPDRGAPVAQTSPNASSLPHSIALGRSSPAPSALAQSVTAPHASVDLSRPSFDVVRVEPTGEAVVAGRAEPGAKVTLFDNGVALDHATADSGGQFAIIPPALAAGDHEFSLRAGADAKARASTQSVTVIVPSEKSGRLIVALAAPGQPTRVLADEAGANRAAEAKPDRAASQAQRDKTASALESGSAPEKKAAAPGQVFIQTVEVGQKGGFFATGSAAPGASLRLYLNNAPVAEATADAQGHWSLRVEKGLRPGSYSVRADQVDAKTGKVASRAEAPFEFQGFAEAAADPKGREPAGRENAPGVGVPAAATNETASSGGERADAVVANLPTVRVVHGESLWRISRKIFGSGMRYTLIYEANASQIRNRDLIYPGQIFVVPKS